MLRARGHGACRDVRTEGRGGADDESCTGPAAAGASAVWRDPSSLTVVTGPSGSGKSTLMHCMAGLDSAGSGQVVLDGMHLTELSGRALTRVRREEVGFLFQSFNLLPQLTALENIVLPLTLDGRSLDHDLLDHLVSVLGIGDRMSHRPGELIGGQQQRVALARALVARPAVVFADEPTGNLDSRSGTKVLELLRRSVRDLDQAVIM